MTENVLVGLSGLGLFLLLSQIHLVKTVTPLGHLYIQEQ